MSDSDKVKVAADFLLVEFTALQERARAYDQMNATRVNFFLLAVGAVSAGLIAAADIPSLTNHFQLAAVLILGLLFLAGLQTLRQTIDTAGMIVIMFRYAGRVRRWFVDFAPDIETYTAFEPADDRPSFTTSFLMLRGGEGILLLTNSALAGGVLFFILISVISNLWPVVLAAVIGGVGTWFLQLSYIRRKMKRVETSTAIRRAIRFPTNPGDSDQQSGIDETQSQA